MDIYCRVTDIGLIPMYDSDLDEKHRLRIGDNVLCTIKRPRNYEFHKKYFSLLRLTLPTFRTSFNSKCRYSQKKTCSIV